jgi:phage gpG-like protein
MFSLQIETTFGTFWDKIKTFVRLTDDQLERIAEVIRKSIEDNIEKGKEYTGGNIRPLLPSTIIRKGNARPLVETGELLRSVEKAKSGNEYNIFIGSSRSEVAKYLHFGTGNIKRMPFFGVSKEAEEKIEKIVFESFL